MKLQEVEQEIRDIAQQLCHPVLLPLPLAEYGVRLAQLADQIPRRKAVQRAPVASRRMTKELRGRIRADIDADKAAGIERTWEFYAQRWGVNTGRISEIMSGKRQ